MLFSSIPFLFYFLPAVLIVYFAVPKCLKNTVLLLFSLLFYGWGEPRYIIFMLISVVCGYVSGLLLEKWKGRPAAKAVLWGSAAVFLGMLGYFKYADFFIENFSAVTGLSVKLLGLTLPIGISFYTFQILSYTIDVYRGDAPAQRNPIHLAAYIALFPQLIAGPIVRYADVAAQLTERPHSFEKTALGIRRFLLGLGKKVLIANALGEIAPLFADSGEKSVLFYWLYAVSYSLQIYFDFSGYSDMAIGLGHILGFTFMENFDHPYMSRSITEFWRRWHISLGSWFRDYVYIPLGGNRVGKARWLLNILIVWFLTGFWHGAAWNFIVWGLYFAVFLVAEKLWLKKYLDKSKALCHVYVVLTVVVSFVIFGAADLGAAMHCLGGMTGFADVPAVTTESLYYLRSYAPLLVIACIGATPFPKQCFAAIEKKCGGVMTVLEPCLLAVLLLVVTGSLVNGSFNPFLYFRF
ncbi:MAG: MBOAT family protein [Ruminococcus sp.]|nr:MBOAT family protein [Ruminococcus sp.]